MVQRSVNPTSKKNAEAVLKQLGIPMSTAVDMYLNQIALVGGIPFPVLLPKGPPAIDADRMTEEALTEKLLRGVADADEGRTQPAREAFRDHRSRREE